MEIKFAESNITDLNFTTLRKKHLEFIYDRFTIKSNDTSFEITFEFEITGLEKFSPKWVMPKSNCFIDESDPMLKTLAFNLGMAELVSYWKITCAPNIKINAGYLSSSQIEWWKKQYYHGLGEFFYINGIETAVENFMEIETTSSEQQFFYAERQLNGCLIPVGGGKDSVTTLELLKSGFNTNSCYIINPRAATLETASTAGYPSERTISVSRTLDSRMLALNKKGYLNGHTPFSVIVAFSAILSAYIHGKKYVVLSNESSANESTVENSTVNHQYSKSFQFESDFAEYEANYIHCGVSYFSLLRPFSEYQIARYFSLQKKYHKIFKSCNAGSKTDSWCCKCPKCLFVYIILSAFMEQPSLTEIFGKYLLEDMSFKETLDKLTGVLPEKPFECVGSRDEINTAICEAIDSLEVIETLPPLLAYYKELDLYSQYKNKKNLYLSYYNEENLIPNEFLTELKDNMLNSKKYILGYLEDKKVLLLGFGKEGRSTFNFLRAHFDKHITIADKNPVNIEGLSNISLISGENYLSEISNRIDEYDLIFKSPGIVLGGFDFKSKLTSQTDIFLKYYREQIIGITGTKGKSTTSSLTHHILKSSGKNAILLGNIGIPAFDMLEKIDDTSIIVFELSSHQLEYARHSPHIAVLLNIFEEHLDHYGTFEKYVSAKNNIYKFQKQNDYLICNINNVPAESELTSCLITVPSLDNHIKVDESKNPLKGEHNAYNIDVSYALSKFFDISDEDFLNAIETFKPLPHRLEYAGTYNGVIYYNDSISTICETTIQAVKSLKKVGTIILGGMDRGISYHPLAEFIIESSIDNIILIPDTGTRLMKLLSNTSDVEFIKKVIMADNLEHAVSIAAKITQSGKICLFSPAAASYGFFRDFEERGEMFKKYLTNLS